MISENRFTQLKYLMVFLVSSLLIFGLYSLSFRTLNSIRAYTHGESAYSKGQKDASRFLLTYLITEEEIYKNKFNEEIKIPKGDGIARRGMESFADDSIVAAGFLQGRNHPEDIENMIWLYKNFKYVQFMAEAITYWVEADNLIVELESIAAEIFSKSGFNREERLAYSARIQIITEQLTIMERSFSDTIGEAGRQINKFLFIANMMLSLGGIITLFVFFRSNLIAQRKINSELKRNNQNLNVLTQILSHDLRAPLASMEGLVDLLEQTENKEEQGEYFNLLRSTLQRQKSFIRGIIDFFKSGLEDNSKLPPPVPLAQKIHEIIDQVKHMDGAQSIHFEVDIPNKINIIPQVGISVILQNIISNAIRYSDDNKSQKKVEIKAFQQGNILEVVITDNGIGMNKETQKRIFERFYTSGEHEEGIGLGMYITIETLKRLNGYLDVHSVEGKGSTFILKFPLKK